MQRLPERFEKQVLHKGDMVFWDDQDERYIREYDCVDCCNKDNLWVSPYEIAARGLEAIFELKRCPEYTKYRAEIMESDSGLLETAFKAIKEIYDTTTA